MSLPTLLALSDITKDIHLPCGLFQASKVQVAHSTIQEACKASCIPKILVFTTLGDAPRDGNQGGGDSGDDEKDENATNGAQPSNQGLLYRFSFVEILQGHCMVLPRTLQSTRYFGSGIKECCTQGKSLQPLHFLVLPLYGSTSLRFQT